MRTSLLAILMICASVTFSYAQNPFSVKGSTLDTVSNVPLLNSTIMVLNSKDSTLVRFGRADEKGLFSLTNLKEGKFILWVSYPDYADYVEHFSLDASKPVLDFGKIRMVLAARLLQEVIIKGDMAQITIKGDTTEFNAAAFKIEANSKVEDLLKQMPGFQVDKDGKITAQGQVVNKVLVDGEEFFGDDPTLVTKNIRGDMVDKVQLYDKKSDQATFTGVDDGERTKTINIKLKEDKKNGYFGKVDGGSGNDEFYQGQVMFNMFKGKEKFSVYGTIGNTNKTGLGYQDANKYGSSTSQVSEEGYIYFGGGSGDELDSYDGRYNGEGIPVTKSGGVHYDTKWNEDKQSINLNYKIGTMRVEGSNNTVNQNNLPTGIINTNSGSDFDKYLFRHRLDATYLVKLDTTAELKVMADGTLRNSSNENLYNSLGRRGDNTPLNDGTRLLSNSGDQASFNASILLTKKLKKKGRTLSLTLWQRYSDDDADGYLNSTNRFYDTSGMLDSTQIIDQYKTNINVTSAFNSNLAYTEPLSKYMTLSLNYGLNFGTTNSDRRSFNRSASGSYNLLDGQFSNNFDLDQTSNQTGATVNYRKTKTVINFGSRMSFVDFKQKDLFNNSIYTRSFINWSPLANYTYNFSARKSFRFNYSGFTQQPALSQIQPIRVNNDPLNIIVGNPGLKQSFSNRFGINYNTYKVLSDKSLYLNASYSFVTNAIVNSTVTDAAGKSSFQAVNLSNKTPSSIYMYADYTQKIPNSEFRIGLYTNSAQSRSYSLINNVYNKSSFAQYSVQLNIGINKLKKYDFYLYIGPEYSTNESSLQKQFNSNGLGASAFFNGNYHLPGKLVFTVNGSMLYQPATQSFAEDFTRLLINTSLTKSFLKGENLKLQLSGNDLLNQNTGFNRRTTGNMIVQNNYTTIKRYGMFSLIYDFSKMGGEPQKN